jgi:hypothetical protein
MSFTQLLNYKLEWLIKHVELSLSVLVNQILLADCTHIILSNLASKLKLVGAPKKLNSTKTNIGKNERSCYAWRLIINADFW